MSASAATVEFDHAAKTYPGTAEPAIRDLTLEVPAGKLTIFIGPSGSGKTTAMRLVNRMIELTSGDVRVDGVSVADQSPAQLRRGIGYAIQQIGLFPHLTVADNIATVPKLLGWDHGRIRTRTCWSSSAWSPPWASATRPSSRAASASASASPGRWRPTRRCC
jgi:osmoprotectant transport system ATP-binding protein